MERYADIVLPLAQPVYTFSVPEELGEVAPGRAVAVQFGARKFYTGIVWRVHERRPDFKRIKPLQRLLYDRPLLTAEQMALWEWVASYYMCSLGEVMRAALPSLMKPSADSFEGFADEEFRPRTETYFTLAPGLYDPDRLHEVFEKLQRRAPKQYEALLELASAGPDGGLPPGEVPRRLLQADRTVLHALERKGFMAAAEHERTVERGAALFRLPVLSDHQRQALETLRGQFAGGKSAALLHGVTSSGKTELYIHLIAEVLAQGGDVLLLVPEIALTAQLIERMERIFGSRVTPYHSRLTDRQRSETYFRLNRSQGGEFVVGVRSSIFLPLRRLQLVIVDEEHDASYKQSDPAPRYHARDCAVVMARIFGGRTLLGSATPSLETWVNAEGGKYGRATLAERYGDARMPEIIVSDTLRAARRGERHAHFNKLLLDKLGETADIVIGCAGGGSNLGGLAAPFFAEKLTGGKGARIIAVEPSSCPSLTRGQYRYDFCDTAKTTPLAKMYTLGCDFIPSASHAGGLRYHGMSPVLSKLYADGLMEARSYRQTEVFAAAVKFARIEGTLPAPESAHAIKAAFDVAEECKRSGEAKTIVFGLTGTGYFDMTAYEKFHDGQMEDYIPTDAELEQYRNTLPKIG